MTEPDGPHEPQPFPDPARLDALSAELDAWQLARLRCHVATAPRDEHGKWMP